MLLLICQQRRSRYLEEVADGDPNKITFVCEFRKHRLFFLNYGKFENTYEDWYSFERVAQHEILLELLFDASHYAKKVDGISDAKHAFFKYGSTESPNRKRTWERDQDLREAKVPRQRNGSPSSFRGAGGSIVFSRGQLFLSGHPQHAAHQRPFVHCMRRQSPTPEPPSDGHFFGRWYQLFHLAPEQRVMDGQAFQRVRG